MTLYAGLRNGLSILKPHHDLASVKRWLLEDAVCGDDLQVEGYSDLPAPMSGYRYDWDMEAWVDTTHKQ
jgi:hypothetical protein